MTEIVNAPDVRRQLRLVALVLVPVLAIVALAWFLLLRTEMTALATNVRPEEAAAIVAELKKQDVPYEIRDDGATLLVPADQANELRLSLVAGGVASAGTVGFELFNQSDMGLTDFAQKVNYQRALQGELTRTIVAMDGIAAARVHLSLPERSLFRAVRSEPRAAVTLETKPGIVLDPARVAGIQQLVASAVADLKPEMVSVLNGEGQLVSTPLRQNFGAELMQGATALERAYGARIGDAINGIDPALTFDVKVVTNPRMFDPAATIPTTPAERNFAVRAVIYTPSDLAADRQAALSSAVAAAIGASSAAGDELRFALTPAQQNAAADLPGHARPPAPVEPAARPGQIPFDDDLLWAMLAALAAGAGIVAGLAVRRNRALRRERLVNGLREQLRLERAG